MEILVIYITCNHYFLLAEIKSLPGVILGGTPLSGDQSELPNRYIIPASSVLWLGAARPIRGAGDRSY